jgi:hypothetical protein
MEKWINIQKNVIIMCTERKLVKENQIITEWEERSRVTKKEKL